MLATRRHILALSSAFVVTPVFAAKPPIVFAAASLKNALDQVSQDLFAMRLSYGGSGALARQILQGAPADVFLSANAEWMDVVQDAGLLLEGGRRNILSNRLVLIGGKDAAPVDLAGWVPEGRIAMGFVQAVPAGQYGKAAFKALGIWNSVKPMVVEVENVRSALALVARGELPYAVVYASDALAQQDVTVLHEFEPDLHPKVTYPLGLLKEAGRKAFEMLASAEAAIILKQSGFEVS